MLLLAEPALGAERRLLLLTTDAQLSRAVALALAPWGVTTQPSQTAPPAAQQPEASRQAEALAQQRGVGVVVWVSSASQGSVLWVYDADRDELTTRVLADSPPFSSPAAASVALSLKTLLRATALAPDDERFDGGSRPPRRQLERLTLDAGGDVRFLASDRSEVRAAVGGVVWFETTTPRWGAGLSFGVGPGVTVERADFFGTFRQLSLSASLRWQVVATRWLASSLSVGGSAYFAELGGFARQSGQSSVSRRVLPALDAGTGVDVTPTSGIRLGLGVKASYLPVRQRYLVEGAPVFELWPVAAEFGVRFGVNAF
jgi:hypothetical protein